MTVSPYIAEASRRAALPIRVGFFFEGPDVGEYFYVQYGADWKTAQLRDTPAEAIRAYFALVASLTPTTPASANAVTPPVVGTSDGCSAISAPEGGM